MITQFEGPHLFDVDIITDWNSSIGGVYYCGVITTERKLIVYYVGRAVGDGGIRSRLLQHLSENKWYDVTHFGYKACDSMNETIDHEISEISRLKPKYNIHHK